MSSKPIRNQEQDHLLTPMNSALVLIDFQPIQISSEVSIEKRNLIDNVTALAKGAKLFGLPIVVSTVNVKTGYNKPMIHQLAEVLAGIQPFDRTSINAWEDQEFQDAVKATGRKKLIVAAIWTEACLTYPVLDMLHEGYEVYPVVDAVGGTSLVAHNAAISRITQAGAKPTSWVQVLCELQRDWNRHDTAEQFAKILFTVEGA